MISHGEVRRVALSLPGTIDESSPDRLVFSVAGRGYAWTYFGRPAPKKPRVAFPDVLAVRCALDHKEMLIEAAPDIYFEDDHYHGYPAVLVRLARIDAAEFAALLDSAWRLQTSKPARRPRARKKP